MIVNVLRLWLLNKHSFGVSIRFCLFIVRPLAGCACIRSFGCSICTPLAFPWVFPRRPLAGYICFCSSRCSMTTPLAFPCFIARLLADL